ncbi:oligopeptide/dipeptide ABC transporter, ATP-binding protein [Desulfosporosinus orientis DSM 765]|uniref:Oligopeptide/dipeptide ABC transporter, ATP-binding protein n=1 Tax=Desulfosporosinus orientis (strain ATCC 19365 / DSM 765 / NCIMB 8382 / VKM B-1628 / Singapore I) TaxID=768706 RepID=G7WE13_DESOD|nr:ABC transporter ATP-binding protein [Desulfosporosinus orientis]AET69411.1 oligopeptide/dipeptide ABC transporter, ATP-binding protein [Desulfosporosinus orientis DSM 765]
MSNEFKPLQDDDLLRINNLNVQFRTAEGVFKAVRDVSLSLRSGETLGIVGESGSGKSVTALSIMNLISNPPGEVAGEIYFNGRDMQKLSAEEVRQVRGNEIAMIFQEPMTSLNPIHTCGKQIMEPLLLHKTYSRRDAKAGTLELLKRVGIPLPEQRFKEYPHQLSGGMRQRVMIAMALACRPKLLLADEPTTALDVTIQAQILELMKDLRQETGSAIIMITHDLGIISEMCHRVVVMYAGQVVESGPLKELIRNPLHPYTEGLLKSIPAITKVKQRLHSIEGTVPSPFNMPRGCSFQPRCSYATALCAEKVPDLSQVAEDREVRCWRHGGE